MQGRRSRLLRCFALTLAMGATACARKDGANPAPDGAVSRAATIEASRPPQLPAPIPSAGVQERARAAAERAEEREHLARSIQMEGVSDRRVLDAIRRVPRHRFVPESMRGEAYADRPLPIGSGQTISQPYIVAAMTEAVAPKATDRCLEIGTGSGYQAAVLAEVCGRTYSIEYLADVAAFGARNLRSLGYEVELRTGDGYQGWPDAAPFDVIVVTAAPEKVPQPLLDQLGPGGRLVVPVGAEGSVQNLELWTRRRAGSDSEAFDRRVLAAVRFVPFLGGEGREP